MARAVNDASKQRLAWRIQNVAPTEAEIDLFDVIGDPWDGTTAKDFITELRALDVDTIRLNINSPGGYVNEALGIYDAILNHRAEVTAHIVVAASAASFVAMAADRREITRNGKVFIHDAQGFGMGDADAMRALADILDEESDNIASIYAERAGGTAAAWRERMQAEGFGTTYRGQEAVDIGLVDEIAVTPARNVVLERIAAQEPTELEAPDLASLLSGERIAEHIGYKPPIPSLEGLLSKHPVKFAGSAR